MALTCLILDDELWARELLRAYCERIGDIEVRATCCEVYAAKKYLEEQSVDVILLDIEMPQEQGLTLLDGLSQFPQIIFTTAYSHYAVKGFELGATDYLVKPIGFQRFKQAIDRARARLNQTTAQPRPASDASIWVREGYTDRKIQLADIEYVEAMREYVAYHTMLGRILELKPLSRVAAALPSDQFIRIHRSYIVARQAVVQVSAQQVTLRDNRSLPIGKTYRQKMSLAQFR